MTSFSVAPLSNLFARGINRFVSVVEKKRSASIRSFSCLLLAFVCLSQVAWGQVTVTVTGESNTTPALNASYSSLASAITALNSVTAFSGPVVLTCATGTETAPAGGYAINFTGATSSTNNVIITTAGTVTITAPNPQTSGSLTDAIFKIIGSDWVTISGFTMLENASNTTTTAASNNMTEWGVALLYASTTNGAQNCTIQNNTITLNRTYQNTFGIYANSTHSAIAATTSASATGAGGGASGLRIYSNIISNVNNGIVVVGPTAAADANTGIDIGGTSLATGNTLTNYGTTGTFSSYVNVSGTVNGILVRNSIGFNIAFNSITSSNGGVTVGTLNGIQIPAASTAPTSTFTNNILGNIISLQSGLITGAINGIEYPSGSASTTSVLNVNGNSFTRLNYSVTASGAIVAINVASTNLTTSISSNTFNNLSVNSSGSFTFINHAFTIPGAGSMNLDNNSIVTAFNKTVANGNITIFSSASGSSLNGTSFTYSGNNFSNINSSGTSNITGITNTNGFNSGPNKLITGNNFSNWTTASGSVTGISITRGGTVTCTISGNIINNLNNTSSITAISLGSTNAGLCPIFISNNTISGLTSSGTGGTVVGISSTNGAAEININGNTVSSLSSTASSVLGISATGSATLHKIYSNKVHSLASSSTSASVTGVVSGAGTTSNLYNNLVGLLTSPNANAANAVIGINVSGGTAANVSFNSIYANNLTSTASTITATTPVFGATGVLFSATTNVSLRNNIIRITGTPIGAGNIAALRRSSAGTAGVVPSNYLTSSGNNLFFAGMPSNTNLVYVEGASAYTNTIQTIEQFRTFMANRDQYSVSVDPVFQSVVGSSADFLKYDIVQLTPLENGGVPISDINTDFSGTTTRDANFPDIGAWELPGRSLDVFSPVISLSPIPNSCPGTYVLTATITDPSGIPTSGSGLPRLFYSVNGGAYVPVTGTFLGTGRYSFTFSSGSTSGETISYYLVAQDNASTPNVGAFPSDGTSSLTTSPPAAGTPPTTPLSFTTITAASLSITASASATPAIICSGSNTTLNLTFSNPTAAPATYLPPPAVTNPTTDEDIGNVAIFTTGSITTTVLSNTSTYNSLTGSIGTATGTAGSYSNYTAFGPYTLLAGQPYAFSISTLQGTTPYGNSAAIYIDYNRNGVFTDPGEAVYVAAATVLGAHTETGIFTIPATAFSGPTRMRVVCNEGLVTGPTMTVSYGEYEDYMLNIVSSVIDNNNPSSFSWASNVGSITGTGNPVSVPLTFETGFTGTATINGCLISASTSTVTVNPLPASPTINNNITQCGDRVPSVFLTHPLSAGSTSPTFNWYNSSTATSTLQSGTSNSYAGIITTTTTLFASVVSPTTLCESPRVPVTVTVTAANPITAAASTSTISCLGGSVNLSVSQTGTAQSYALTWSATTSAATSGLTGTVTATLNTPLTVTPTAPGTYNYRVTGIDGDCQAVSNVSVVVNNPLSGITAAATASPTAVCSGSNAVLTMNIGNAVAATYLPPPPVTTPTADEDIGNVTIFIAGTPSTTILNNTSTYNSLSGSIGTAVGTAGGFANYTAFGPYNLSAGQTYSFSVSTLAGTTPYNNSTAIYIDYNRDGDFLDAGENVYVATVATPGAHTESGTFTVPATAFNGLTRMRVICHESTTTNALITGPNMTVSWGEFEEYAINIASSSVGGGATVTPTAYSWSNGSSVIGTTNPLSVSITSDTRFTGTATVNGCPISASTSTVTVVPLPTAPVATNSTQCGTKVPTASVTDPNGFTTPTFRWYSAGTATATLLQSSVSSTYTGTVASTTTFHVSVINPITGCESARTPVTVTVVSANPITASASITNIACLGSSTNLSVTQTGTANTYSLSWSLASYSGSGLAGPVSATLNTPLTVVPTAAGTYNYIVVGTESGGLQCRSESTVSVVVNDPLSGVLATASTTPSSVCLGSSSSLNLDISRTAQLVVGDNLGTSIGTTGNPYRTGTTAGNQLKTHFLVLAAELSSAGYTAGRISSIGLEISTATPTGVMTNFSIGMANVTESALTSTFLTNQLTPVFAVATYTPTTGLNTHTFSTPFIWDGSSNVLIQINSVLGTVGSGTSLVTSTTPSGIIATVQANSSSGFSSTTGTTITNQRPRFTFVGNTAPTPTSYSWASGSVVAGTNNPQSVSPTSSTSYVGTAVVGGCPISASPVTVTTIALPTAPTATNSNQCGAQVPLASVSDQNGFTNPVFRWYSAGTSTATLLQSSTSATYTGTIATTTTLHVAVVNPTTGCESLRTPVTVSVTQPNPLTAAATVSTVNCLGGGTSLSVTQTGTTNTYVLTWTASSYAGSGMSASTSATLNTPIALVPTAAGTYTFTVTGVEASTGCVAVSSVGVVVNDPLLGVTASASITPTVICAGTPTTLTMNLARTPLTESFDGNPLSQFTLLNVAGTSGSVTTSTTYFAEGTGSVRLNAGTSADARLIQTSSISLSNAASATLTFSHICASEATYDFGVPIFSTDGGTTWFAFPASSYQGSGTLAFTNDIVFDKASYSDWNSTFTAASSTPGTGPATSLWKTETIAIPAGALSSTSFKIGFAYDTDGSVNYYGWLIDNVSIRVVPNATYSWSNGTSVVGTTNPLTITPAAGNYSLTGTATVGGCPISAAAVTLTVNPLPSVAAITGTAAVCVGNTTTLTNTTTGGVWTSANAAVATISSSGVVTGVTAGTSTITYTVTNATTGCVNSVTQLVTVNALPVVSTITGTASVCVGLTTTLSTTTAGGVWSSANSAIATVSATGVVSGISAGSVTISYTVTNSNNCVTTVTRVVTVNPLPVVPAITGASSVCMNSSITLANTTPNGVWTTSNSAVASVSSSGVVTGIAGGTAIITYTVTSSSGCVTAVSTVVTVNILPSVTGVITQPTTCVSFDGAINITAAGPAVGPYSYTWSTPNGIAPVANAEDQTGLIVGDYNVVVTAANGCTVNRTFTLVGPGGCDICPTITSMTASPNPPCVGSPTTLTVSGLSDMGVTFGITFKMSTTPLTNPYTQGTVIQTVTNSGLSNGNTSATASVSFPAPGTYYVYSIITPQPLGVACRPTKSVTITVDPLPTVTAISNQIVASGSSTTPVVFAGGGVSATYNWTNSNTALIPISQGAGNIAAFAVNNSGTSPISTTIAAIATSPNAAGQSCVGTTATSFTITVNPVPTMAQPANTTLVNAIASTAINFATLNTGGTTTYAWTNSNPAIGLAASGTGSLPVFTPVNAGTAPVTATITVTPTYTNSNGGPSTAGASREFTITVNPTAQVNTVANQFVCSGATLSSTVFGTVNTGGTTTYAWTNSNTAIGLAASGTGNIPAFAATNAQAGVISSTITVTPSYTNAGVTTAGTPVSYVITVNPAGQVNPVLSQVLCAGSTTTAATLSTTNQQGINVPASATASSGAISLAIPDNAPAGVTSTLPVSLPAGATVTGVRVTLNATHTWVSDLVINLRAPNGQVLNLFNGHGGSGDDLVNTVISSAGTASLASATAPFTGTFAATGALNVGATGQTSTTSGFPALYSGGSGNWVLSLRDQVGFDVGTLNSWAITVDYTTLLGGLTTYTWTNSNSGIGLAASGSGNTIAAFTASNTTSAPIVSTVTVTPTYTNGGLSCAGAPITYTYTVNPIPTVNVANQVLCAGTPATVNFTGATTGTVYNWTSSNAAIGLAVSGTGNLSFTPTNTTNAPISSTVTVTPVFTNAGVTCTGTPRTFTITVNPVGQVNTVLNQVLCNGANTTPVSFATVNGGGTVVAGTPVTANSGAITVAIPDASAAGVTHSLPVTLPAGATITGVSVNFNMTHTWLSDMVVNLRAPNGQVLNLVNRRGGSGDNFVNTTISSASTTSLATGAAPFTGTFAADAAPTVGPTGFEATATNFAALYSVANGNWTLGMRDYAAGDNGTLTGWSITFNYTTVEGAVTTYNWTNNTPSIGLAASGVGNIASFAAANTSAVPVTATVTVTPTYTNSGVGCAGPSTTFTYTVNPTPTVSAVSNQTVCRGASVAAINFAGTVSGTVYNWTNNNTAIGLGASGTGNIPSFVGTNTTSAPISATITVTPVSTINGITCTGTPRTFTITINPIPTVNAVASFAICHNSPASVTFSGATTGTVYNWTNSNTTIGLGASGSGNLAFTALNTTSGPQVANIVVTPAFTNGGTTCTGTSTSFTITVNPLPVVSAGTLPARICISDTLVPLNGTPVGGSWSGIGTSGMSFVPTATAVGTWPITYTFADLNGCVNRATIPVTVLSCDERDRDLNSSGVQLYPNPNNGRFNLRVNSTRFNMLGMRVFNTAGQLVSVKQWSDLVFARVVPVDLSNLPAGIYMVRLYYGDGMDRGADKTFQVIIAR